MLPILHLNGWKIANPAVLARLPEDELDALLRGYGYEPAYVTGDGGHVPHLEMAATLDAAIAGSGASRTRPGPASAAGPA